MSTIKSFAVALLAVSGVVVAQAQVTKQGSSYLFRAKYAKGSTIKYFLDSSGSFGTMAFTAKFDVTEKVQNVAKGIATINFKLGKPNVTLNGKPFTQFPLDGQEATIKLDNLGQGTDGEVMPTHIRYPQKPVAVGGKWTGSSAQMIGGQRQKGSTTYKLAGFENVGNQRAAKLTFTTEAAGTAKVSVTGTAWVSMADGLLLKEVGKAKATTQNKTAPATFTLVRK